MQLLLEQKFLELLDQVKVTVYTAKPGVAIGKKGAGIEKVKVILKNSLDNFSF